MARPHSKVKASGKQTSYMQSLWHRILPLEESLIVPQSLSTFVMKSLVNSPKIVMSNCTLAIVMSNCTPAIVMSNCT